MFLNVGSVNRLTVPIPIESRFEPQLVFDRVLIGALLWFVCRHNSLNQSVA